MKTVKLNWFWFLSLFSLGMTFLATLLAIGGKFTSGWLLATFFILAGLFYWLFKRDTFQKEKLNRPSLALLAFLFVLGGFLSYSTQPTIFGGRDEGSYSNAAILLAQKGDLADFSTLSNNFHQIYGTGKALNFPGFNYTEKGEIKSQFLPAYPVWLALFYKLFGLNGLKVANLLPLVLLAFSIFSLFQLIFSKNWKDSKPKDKKLIALLPVLFLITSLPLIIFYKFTLGEIWFASLLWTALYLSAVYFDSQRNRAMYYLIFLPLLLMPLSRIEGPVIIFMFLLFFILENSVNLKKVEYQTPIVGLTALFFLTVIWEPNFFINGLKGIAEPFFPSQEAATEPTGGKFRGPDDWKNFYLGKIFFIYNLWPFWLMMAASLWALLKNFWSGLRAKNHLEFSLPLLPFFVSLPTFFYFWDANISLDHPWMLRRFVFSLLPVAFFYSALFLGRISQKSRLAFYGITFFLLLANLSLFQSSQESLSDLNKTSPSEEKKSISFFSYTQNKDLFSQVEKLDQRLNLEKNDLVLISQKASGSGWSMLAEPWRNLLGRNAIYFFNPNDLDKIDREKFDRIFLLTSENEEALYQGIGKDKFLPYSLSSDLILPSRDPDRKSVV